MWLLTGLGNPGREYEGNRHNIGFMVADELARRAGGGWKSKFGGELLQGALGGQPVLVLKPMQFMNLSGKATAQAATFYKVAPDHIIVIHDELDMDFGRLQVKVGGGHGGHNGLRSITQDLGSADFLRIRCGIGRPGSTHKDAVAGYVLANFAKADHEEVRLLVGEAADAVEAVLELGPTAAMNRFNTKKPKPA